MKKIIGILLCITVVMGLCACGNKEEKAKETESTKIDIAKCDWRDTLIELDGKILHLGDTLEEVMECGFETKTELKTELKASELTVINFTYEKNGQTETICMGLKNNSKETANIKNSTLENFSFSNWLYEKFEVVLPGGVKLSKETRIADIVDKWGEYSEKVSGDPYSAYIWTIDGNNLTFTTNNETGEIKQISYTGPSTVIGK